MAFHNGMFFSTFDRDNDRGSPYSCALARLGGWWYNDCHRSNLNGEYGNTGGSKGINWYHWKGFNYSMKGSKTLTLKICESIKPYALCYGTYMTFFLYKLKGKVELQNYEFYEYILCYWIFSMVIVFFNLLINIATI